MAFWLKPALYALLGAATGAMVAACVLFLPLEDVPSFRLFGRCVGMVTASECKGLSLEYYLFPGLIFGLAFGILLSASGKLVFRGVAFALAAVVSNALAVAAWTAIADPISDFLGQDATGDRVFLVTGAIAGALGGGLLGYGAPRLLRIAGWLWLLAVGAALGLLLPLVGRSMSGFFAFYILWQAGYAAMLGVLVRRGSKI